MRRSILLVMALALSGCAKSEAEKFVAGRLKDPASAQFRSVLVTDEGACGEVADKGFGRYVRFVYDKRSGEVRFEDPNLGGGSEEALRLQAQLMDLKEALVCGSA